MQQVGRIVIRLYYLGMIGLMVVTGIGWIAQPSTWSILSSLAVVAILEFWCNILPMWRTEDWGVGHSCSAVQFRPLSIPEFRPKK